jgi:hypothetical protein
MQHFPNPILSAIRAGKYFGIRAGDDHRFIAIWVVEVGNRLFARSWTMKGRGWRAAFLKDPIGAVKVGTRTVKVRAVPVRSERLKDAVSKAYFVKYDTKSALVYCRGFARGKRRDSTMELQPYTQRSRAR